MHSVHRHPPSDLDVVPLAETPVLQLPVQQVVGMNPIVLLQPHYALPFPLQSVVSELVVVVQHMHWEQAVVRQVHPDRLEMEVVQHRDPEKRDLKQLDPFPMAPEVAQLLVLRELVVVHRDYSGFHSLPDSVEAVHSSVRSVKPSLGTLSVSSLLMITLLWISCGKCFEIEIDPLSRHF